MWNTILSRINIIHSDDGTKGLGRGAAREEIALGQTIIIALSWSVFMKLYETGPLSKVSAPLSEETLRHH